MQHWLTYEPVYGTPEEYPDTFPEKLAAAVADTKSIIATVSYSPLFRLLTGSQPQLVQHPGSEKVPDQDGLTVYSYPQVSSSEFIMPHKPGFSYATAAVAHTRAVTFVKKYMGGPIFDLEKIWDEHTYWEFENRSVEKTMATMVREPYVNHITTVRHLPAL